MTSAGRILISLLLFHAIAEASGPTGGTLFFTRTRTSETEENYRVFLNLSFDPSSLTRGADSVLRIETSNGDSHTVGVTRARDEVSCLLTKHFSDLTEAAGIWKFTINDGISPEENLRIEMPLLSSSDFPAYLPFPTLSYQGDPRKAFVPYAIGQSQGGSIQPFTSAKYDPAAIGSIYTIPVGGPYTGKTTDYRDLPMTPVTDALGQPMGRISTPRAWSESVLRFYSGVHKPFAASISLKDSAAEFNATGLTPGATYRLRTSADAETWTTISTFEAVANAYFHVRSVTTERTFFLLEEAGQPASE